MELTFTLVPHKASSMLSTPTQEPKCGRQGLVYQWGNQSSPVSQLLSKSLLFQRGTSSQYMVNRAFWSVGTRVPFVQRQSLCTAGFLMWMHWLSCFRQDNQCIHIKNFLAATPYYDRLHPLSQINVTVCLLQGESASPLRVFEPQTAYR